MKLAIYGAGGFAREVAWLAESCREAGTDLDLLGFVDDDAARHGTALSGYPVLGLDALRDWVPDAQVVVAVGNPTLRERLTEKVAAAGFGHAMLVDPGCRRSRSVGIGRGTVVCAGTILTCDINVGDHVQINLDCTVGHDAVFDRFATLAPGVHVSGFVHVGRRAYIGTGAAIINGRDGEPLVIGEDAVVGAGAVVTKDVAPGTTVVGVPARPMR